MSLSRPSHVSPTTGSDHRRSPDRRCATACATRASRTTPTLWVFVMPIAPPSRPASRIHSSPVSSPLPLSRWQPANTGSAQTSPSWGRITVTPVRTGPWPTTSGPSPSMRVVWPTRTPATSVMALHGPGRPRPMTIPRSRARIRAGYPSAQGRGGPAGRPRLSSPGDRHVPPAARRGPPGRPSPSRPGSSAGRHSTVSPRWTPPSRSVTSRASPSSRAPDRDGPPAGVPDRRPARGHRCADARGDPFAGRARCSGGSIPPARRS